MKFSHTVQFNAVPEWRNHYIAYSNLKKLIYQIEKDLFSRSSPTGECNELDETCTLLGANTIANKSFMPALDEELKKIINFYTKKETDLYTSVEKLCHKAFILESRCNDIDSSHLIEEGIGTQQSNSPDLIDIESEGAILQSSVLTGSPSNSDLKPSPLNRSNNKNLKHRSISFYETPKKDTNILNSIERRLSTGGNDKMNMDISFEEEAIVLTKKVIEHFVLLTELKNYVVLNYTGFSKILKKYDKVTGVSITKRYLNETVLASYPYLESTKNKLDDQIIRIQTIYATLRNIDQQHAFEELKSHLREHLVWERNTVWRDMVSLERKAHSVGLKQLSFPKSTPQTTSTQIKASSLFSFTFTDGMQNSLLFLTFSVFFIILINYSPFSEREPANCFALLIFASLLWASEIIPLFVTALLIPFLIVVLKILKEDNGNRRLTAPEATHEIFASMFSPVIMLLLGGFSLASALSKHHIAKKMASAVLSYAGSEPSKVLLANMMVATFASMWISNVAAPVLCFSLIQPLLRTLPSKSPYARSLIMGIALASNIGGMASPISSPQNIIAISNMDPAPTWLQWFAISIPICLVGNILVWSALLLIYKPSSHNLTLNQIRYTPEKFNNTQLFVCFVTLFTIILWCLAHQLESIIGDMGVIAIIPLVLFFGTGILSKDDFNNFLWTVIILAMGGIALGKGVKSSGLLHIISINVKQLILNFNLFQIMAIMCFFVLCITTFISHTVGAVIIFPIIAQIGTTLPDPHPRLLVMSSALMCSSAMGLPVSGFPNMNAIMMEDETGTRYLSVKDFLKAGIPSSILLYGVIISLGYGILLALGF
ncbi:SPX-domain-containing protein [Neoconidiobolus thromboides FSU 785]|nr:SPX-domain-containing protein [Neoconidiobolus thromboides FSU 785]